MSKKALDLEYMKDALKIKTSVKAGMVLLYGVEPPPGGVVLYGMDY